MAEKEESRSLATSASVVPIGTLDEEGASRWRSAQYLRKRQGVLFCCGCSIVTVVVLGFIALILALTVFKMQDPKLTVKGIHVEGLKAAVGTNSSLNATMMADISIKNPNVASFRLENSTTEFFYRRESVGVASIPGGVVSADHTKRMNLTVTVVTRQVATLENTTDGSPTGSVNLTSYTKIKGRVNLFGIFRRKLDVFLNCEMTLDLSLNKQDAQNLVCGANTI
ncbi:unnamed protein product [Spirodela intermedia]|uniref:Late embryogenesis abundant protein LEA-2 subgroup domain-containing protein n=2 Tax=Spirodela intermedia TaxID=51605 RepID=A0A7I8J878_SPIIN|nr:unnamed protein product [Spirodela intermedia]CAA6665945.1 unnamed protein product [Spirodela intermedia]CAA7402703.1 unnamed protein product [Spirodela intermedia]